MKVTLDLTDLVTRGELTKDEADRLAKLGARDTGSLGVNILLGFGTVAVALGGGFLFPTAAVGHRDRRDPVRRSALALILNKQIKWVLFAQICVTIGALGIVGGVSYLSDGNFYVNLALAAGLAVAAFAAASGLLGALAVLQFSIALGGGTAYWHGGYFTWVEEPALTIAVLAVLSIALTVVAARYPLGLRARRLDHGAHRRADDQPRLPRRLDLRRSADVLGLHDPAGDLLRRLGGPPDRRRPVGRDVQPPLGRERGRGLRRHPLLYAVVRVPRTRTRCRCWAAASC